MAKSKPKPARAPKQRGRAFPPYSVKLDVCGTEWPAGVTISIESPAAESTCESFSIEVKGFIIRQQDSGLPRPHHLEFKVSGGGLWVAQLDQPRPDVIADAQLSQFVDAADVNCGFDAILPSFLSQTHDEIEIQVVHETDADGLSLRYPLARVSFSSIHADTAPRSDAIGVVSINSMGRSGSSLVCRVLDAHPNCVAAKLGGQYGEVAILGTYLRGVAVLASDGAMSHLNKFDRFGDFESLPAAYLRTDSGVGDSDSLLHAELMAATRRHMSDLVRDAHACVARYAKAQKPAARFWVEKTWNQTSANLSKIFIKDSREIILVRDIRDFWRSQSLFQEKIGLSASQLAEHAMATYSKYVSLALSYRDRGDEVLLVRYEDLIEDPETEFRRIMAHLSLPFSAEFEAAVVNIVHADDAHRRGMSTAAMKGRGDDFYGYLATIDPEAVAYLKHLLEDFGYAV